MDNKNPGTAESGSETSKHAQYLAMGWVRYEPGVARHGVDAVFDDELKYLAKRRSGTTKDDLAGIALSGGGIRSATFSLGVLQALAHQGWLKRFDYLSTVSGGGYIGSSLTWLLHDYWKDATGKPHFGLNEDDFPYGTHRRGRTTAQGELPGGSQEKGLMLRFLRQHAKYLTPGNGIDLTSLIAVVLRGTMMSLLVYLSLVFVVFLGLHAAGWFGPLARVTSLRTLLPFLPGGMPAALAVSVLALLVFALWVLAYSVATHWSWRRPEKPLLAAKQRRLEVGRYRGRRAYDTYARWLLLAAVFFAVIGSLPLIAGLLHTLAPVAWRKIDLTAAFGAVSTMLGVVAGIGAFVKTHDRKPGKVPLDLLVAVGAVLLLYGLMLLGYQLSRSWLLQPHKGVAWWLGTAGAPAVVLFFGYFVNLNYISIHRFYRDRLMETFMPGKGVLDNPDDPSAEAVDADRTRLHELCTEASVRGPYHLVNTNIILEESKIPKFRGRGGDNFVLSPRYCGSNATGWLRTEDYMDGCMTLSTAMAISGAAINPGAGCGGEGVTRRPVLSRLMTFLNVRLGYWAPNVDPRREIWLARALMRWRYPQLHALLYESNVPAAAADVGTLQQQRRKLWWTRVPNFLWPGLFDLVFRHQLNETCPFIQLSDGGHFENLGLYELIRRKLKLIVVCDGGADPHFTFADLANAVEKARVDFGTLIRIDADALQPLVPRKRETERDDPDAQKFAQRGYLVARIDYRDDTPGYLIYMKTTFFGSLAADLYGYREAHPEFPDESTGDQFFDEKQFEAYRELGFQTAWEMMKGIRDSARKKPAETTSADPVAAAMVLKVVEPQSAT